MKPKIFQVGLNRCGSKTLATFLAINKIQTVHYDRGRLAATICANYLSGKPLIDPSYNEFLAFFDMENIHLDVPLYIAVTLFEQLYNQYPDSKFILNTRDKAAWLKSRAQYQISDELTYLDVIAEKYSLTQTEVLSMWSTQWDEHHRAVIDFFKDKTKQLLIFNIETDPPQKLCDFLKEDYSLNPDLYEHKKSISYIPTLKY